MGTLSSVYVLDTCDMHGIRSRGYREVTSCGKWSLVLKKGDHILNYSSQCTDLCREEWVMGKGLVARPHQLSFSLPDSNCFRDERFQSEQSIPWEGHLSPVSFCDTGSMQDDLLLPW